MSVPVIGYGTDEFPAFYSRQSGLPVSERLDTPEQVTGFARTHWDLGLKSAVLVCLPLPPENEIPQEKVKGVIEQARREGREKGLHGQALTPFLLKRLSELTAGETLRANLALLHNNVKLGAQIASTFSASLRQRTL